MTLSPVNSNYFLLQEGSISPTFFACVFCSVFLTSMFFLVTFCFPREKRAQKKRWWNRPEMFLFFLFDRATFVWFSGKSYFVFYVYISVVCIVVKLESLQFHINKLYDKLYNFGQSNWYTMNRNNGKATIFF